MKKIKLNKGAVALVDDADFEWLNQWKWHLSDNGYAKRSQHIRLDTNKYASKIVWMHRLINDTPAELFTDHINRNKLDNRRDNLRTVNKSLNGLNRDKPISNTSGYKGVWWDDWSGKWRAEMKVNYKKVSLGRYSKREDAIKARREGERIHHEV